MEILRRVLKEEMSAVLASLREDNNYYPDTYQGPVTTDDTNFDAILYDYNKGSLAVSRLQNDIINLDRYDFIDYLPTSEKSEKWNFMTAAANGMELGVEIKKDADKNGTFWTLIFWRKYINETQPEIVEQLNNVKGYDKFVTSVNMSLKDKIDPSKIR